MKLETSLEQDFVNIGKNAEALRRKLIRMRMKCEEMEVETISGVNTVIAKFKIRDLAEELKWLWELSGEGRQRIEK